MSGIAALILSVNPNLTQAQVRNAIESTCTKLSGYSFNSSSGRTNGTWNSEVGHGLVNAYAALGAMAINGPDIIGYSACQESYTISSGLSGVTNVSWSVGYGLSIVQNNGANGIKVSRASNTSHPQNSYVQLSYTLNGQQRTVRRNVQTQIEYSIGISGTPVTQNQYLYAGTESYIEPVVPHPQSWNMLDYNFDILRNGNVIFSGPWQYYTNAFDFPDLGQHTIRMKIEDRCGWSDWKQAYVNVN